MNEEHPKISKLFCRVIWPYNIPMFNELQWNKIYFTTGKAIFFKLINHNHKSDYQNIKLAFLTSYSNENYGNMEN